MSEFRQESDERFASIVNEEWRDDERPTLLDQLDPTLRAIFTDVTELEQYANSRATDGFDSSMEKMLNDINLHWMHVQGLQGRVSVSARAFRTDINNEEHEIKEIWFENKALEESSFHLLQDDDDKYVVYLECALRDSDDPYNYIVNVSDINFIDTEYPSQKAGEEHLRYAYPELIESIDTALSSGTVNDTILLRALQELEIDFAHDHTPTATYSRETIVEWLGGYVSTMINFDNELYQIEVQGEIKKITEGEGVDHFLALPRSTTARIEKVFFMNDRQGDTKNDHNSYRPYLELHIPEVARSTMARVYHVPATAIKNIVSLRNTSALIED